MNSNGGDKLGYIVMPMDLTIEQREVYVYLYKQCNFKDMTCNYTISQIVAAADKRLNMTTRKVRTILKKLLENGYITNVYKGSKGRPSVIKIATIKRQLSDNNMTNKKAQPSDLNEFSDNNMTIKRQLSDNLIKEKEINIYSSNDYEEVWKAYPNKKGKAKSITYINKILKSISKEELLRCIDRYIKDVENQRDNGFKTLSYKNGSTFFNGGYIDYLDKNYQDETKNIDKVVKRQEVTLSELLGGAV